MNKTDEILNAMIRDLKIWQYSGESKPQFVARVVYSALSMWIRVSTLDENIFEPYENTIGVSKVHILNRCQPFLDFMIKTYPDIREWFYPKDEKQKPIETIRERLYNAGELVDIGFNTDLALPSYTILKCTEKTTIARGYKNNDNANFAGIGRYLNTDYGTTLSLQNTWSFYGLDNKEAKIFLRESCNRVKWQKATTNEWEVFDKSSKNSFSRSWGRELKLKMNEVTVYRKGKRDYGFIKNINNQIYYSPISQYLIDQYEVYRLMYGIKAECGNFAMGKFKVFIDDEMVLLHLYNKLPKMEEKILMLLGWPVDSIYDEYKLIFPLSVWKFILRVLENLDIDLQEAN